MEIRLDVHISNSEINIQFDDNQRAIKILDGSNFDFNISQATIYFMLNENNVKYIGQICSQEDKNLDKVIAITVPIEVNLEYLVYAFVEEAIQNEITLDNNQTSAEPDVSDNQKSVAIEYKDKISFILKNFGYDLFKSRNNDKSLNKPLQAKARHKWTKEISQIKFNVKSRDSEGKVIWHKKDKLVLLSGAKLATNPQLNKDGTINYSAQFAQKLRSDYIDKIVDNTTTEDIVFLSPNQLGMFLLYGGQNTWLELKDSNGKTLDEWSRIS